MSLSSRMGRLNKSPSTSPSRSPTRSPPKSPTREIAPKLGDPVPEEAPPPVVAAVIEEVKTEAAPTEAAAPQAAAVPLHVDVNANVEEKHAEGGGAAAVAAPVTPTAAAAGAAAAPLSPTSIEKSKNAHVLVERQSGLLKNLQSMKTDLDQLDREIARVLKAEKEALHRALLEPAGIPDDELPSLRDPGKTFKSRFLPKHRNKSGEEYVVSPTSETAPELNDNAAAVPQATAS